MRKQLKIKAPANSLDSAKQQINDGADEIYLGIFSPGWFSNLSFSHRGRSNLESDASGCLDNIESLAEIVDYAHSCGVTVSYTANIFNLPDTSINDYTKKSFKQGYLEYVKIGIECGVDSVIVANLSEVLLIREAGFNIPIVASCLFMISNEHSYHMLRSLGVSQFYLPHDTNISEIKTMVDLTKLEEDKCEIGVFAHFGCAMLSGGCSWYHKFGEEINFGYPCRNKYKVLNSNQKMEVIPFFDFNFDCSICQLADLINSGVHSIKLVGRASSMRLNSRIIKVYRSMVDKLMDGKDIKQIRDEFIEKEPWWKKMYCENNRCKYAVNTKFKNFIIG